MSRQHKCETCGQAVKVEGKTTQYYVGNEREIARAEMLDEVIEIAKTYSKGEMFGHAYVDVVAVQTLEHKLKQKYGIK